MYAALLLAMGLQAPDALQLARLREHAVAQIHAASNYICLETIERWHRRKPSEKFTLQDVLRLEVTVVGGNEVYSWPGGGGFQENSASDYIAGGMLGTGAFAADLRNVFLNRDVALERGESAAAGTIEYRYKVPIFASGFVVSNGSGSATVASSGVVRFDPRTLEVVELEAKAEDVPVALGIDQVSTRVVYSSIRLGEATLILPSAAETEMRMFDGEEKHNLIAFSHWRQYTAESQIRFEGEGGATAGAPPKREAPAAVPAGLTIVSRLRTAIDPKSAAVGDMVEALVEKDVVEGKKVVLPRGTVLTGRIRRLDRERTSVPYLVLAIELSTAEIGGVAVPVYAALKSVEGGKGIKRKPPGSRTRQTTTELLGLGRFERIETDEYYDRSVLSVASVYIEGEAARIEPGLTFTWLTQSPREVPKAKAAGGMPPPDPTVFNRPTPY